MACGFRGPRRSAKAEWPPVMLASPKPLPTSFGTCSQMMAPCGMLWSGSNLLVPVPAVAALIVWLSGSLTTSIAAVCWQQSSLYPRKMLKERWSRTGKPRKGRRSNARRHAQCRGTLYVPMCLDHA